MRQLSSSFVTVFMGWMAVIATGCGASAESRDVAAEDTDTAAAALADCQINPDGTVFCAQTAITTVAGRKVYYRIGANTGPGYDAATGTHAAVVLFQGTGADSADDPDHDSGGSAGPAATFSKTFTKPGAFGVWYQMATVVALVNSGYTLIQPVALRHNSGLYFWESNTGFPAGSLFNGSTDKTVVDALIAQMQPGASTFGSINRNAVYAMGISSGGYMASRMAVQFASGVNSNSSVIDPNKPFRAVAIESAAYMTCSLFCNPPALPSTHAPTLLLHSEEDMTVRIATARTYFSRLTAKFPNGNPAYAVNGVVPQFAVFDEFPDQPPADAGGHQWSSDLTGDSTNLILQWFNTHR
jgi:hypothetical protein